MKASRAQLGRQLGKTVPKVRNALLSSASLGPPAPPDAQEKERKRLTRHHVAAPSRAGSTPTAPTPTMPSLPDGPNLNSLAAFNLRYPQNYTQPQQPPAPTPPPTLIPTEPVKRGRGRPRGRPPGRASLARPPPTTNRVPTSQTLVPVPQLNVGAQNLSYQMGNQRSGIRQAGSGANPDFSVIAPGMFQDRQVRPTYPGLTNPPYGPQPQTQQSPQMLPQFQNRLPPQPTVAPGNSSGAETPCVICQKIHPKQNCFNPNSEMDLRIALDLLRTSSSDQATIHRTRELLTGRLRQLTGKGPQGR